MGNPNKTLMEMETAEDGIHFLNLSPFYIHTHIFTLLAKANEALTIYKELKEVTQNVSVDEMIKVIRMSSSQEDAQDVLMTKFNISSLTANEILNMGLDELSMFAVYPYQSSIAIYEEAVKALSHIAEMQKSIDKQTLK